MKKKLLIVLLSMFMMAVSTPVVDVFAETFTTSGDIFNTVTSVSSWTNDNGNEFGGVISTGIDAQTVTTTDNLTYTFSWNSMNFTLVTDGTVLKSITIANCPLTDFNGTYAPLTIADILPNDFPTSEDNAWHNKSNNDLKAYISNSNLIIGNTTLGLNECPLKDSDTKYSCQDIEFNLDQSGKLISIVMRISMNNDNGTYAPLTIADILPNDFPTTSASGWIKENYSTKNRIYKDSQNLMIGTSSFPLNGVVTKDGNNYKYQNGMIYINFIMDSNVLNKINFLVMSITASGDYIPYKYTNAPISIIAGSTDDIEFVTNAVYTNDSDVVVRIDNNLTPLTLNQDYTLSSNSTHVTLKGKYVSTLAAGKHTIAIAVVGDDEYSSISQEFTVTSQEVPDTGVYGTNLDNYSLLKLSSLSLLAIGTYLVIKKKKDN